MALSKPKNYEQYMSYTTKFLCFVPYRKGLHFEFYTTCACDVSVAQGGKSDIKLHLAVTKHWNFVRATEKQGTVENFFVNSNDGSVLCVPSASSPDSSWTEFASDHVGPLPCKMFPKGEDV